MKKSAAPSIRRPAKKRNPKTKKGEWHISHVVANATEEKMNRIWDAFIDAVEKEGLYCGGGMHPLGLCANCRD
jgi:hypothetical protein